MPLKKIEFNECNVKELLLELCNKYFWINLFPEHYRDTLFIFRAAELLRVLSEQSTEW